MSLTNNRQARLIEAMTPEHKAAYLATGRVTVGTISQVVKNEEGKNVFKTWYVAKIRGVVVGNDGEYKHDTSEAALKYGREVLEQWHTEFVKSCQQQSTQAKTNPDGIHLNCLTLPKARNTSKIRSTN